jgi:hypothetical protein
MHISPRTLARNCKWLLSFCVVGSPFYLFPCLSSQSRRCSFALLRFAALAGTLLGPADTYSHQVGHSSHHPLAPVLTRLLQAALDRFAETVHYCALDTISGPYARNFLNQL